MLTLKEERLIRLYQIGQLFNSSLQLQKVLDMVMDMVIEVTRAERGFLVLVEKGSDRLIFKTARQLHKQEIPEDELNLSRSIVRRVAEEGQAVLSTNAMEDKRFKQSSSILLQEIRSILCVPMKIKEKIIGVIYVDNRVKTGVFSREDREFLMALANQAAIAIENAQLYENLKVSLAKLEEANRLKDEFLANISHELRTPLTTILGFSEMLCLGKLGFLDEKIRKPCFIIHENGKAMLKLIENLIDLSLIQKGEIRLKLTQIDIHSLIKEILDELKKQIVAKQLKVILHLTADSYFITGDAVRIKRVLDAIIDNSIKFNMLEGKVIISTSETEDSLVIVVKDTGIGIPSESLPLIFESFRQLDGGLTREFGGTGIGLSLAKRLVELHGGKIEVTSTLHKGSSFKIILPKELTK